MEQFACANRIRRPLGVKVTNGFVRGAYIRTNELEKLVVGFISAKQFGNWNAHTFLVDLPCLRRINPPSNIGRVAGTGKVANHPSIKDTTGQVLRLAHNGAKSCTHQRYLLLVHYREQAVPEYFQRYRVDFFRHCRVSLQGRSQFNHKVPLLVNTETTIWPYNHRRLALFNDSWPAEALAREQVIAVIDRYSRIASQFKEVRLPPPLQSRLSRFLGLW